MPSRTKMILDKIIKQTAEDLEKRKKDIVDIVTGKQIGRAHV